MRDTFRAATSRHRLLRERIAAVVTATIVVTAIGSGLMYMFERNARGTDITNIGDATFWTAAQVLSVSSSMSNPLTTGGRIVDVVLMAYAVVVVGASAGAFGAFFFGIQRREAVTRPE